ncbi:FecR family protein [Calycomorphotria hydatis]|uniref:FecR protein n=1 Tax=Calycomorphotria hydatis TaxID=2528027 RepID=A0A517TD57_9PLAN|nr:FecR domain-containing protein [Calycomorphotria hydatis]QDT66304.1 FecR protein [Calycomorphotria hydatis]
MTEQSPPLERAENEVRRILDAAMNGTASQSQLNRLHELIAADGGFSFDAVNYIDAGTELRQSVNHREPLSYFVDQARKKPSRVTRFASVAAAVVGMAMCLAMVAIWFQAPAVPVGRISLASPDVQWKDVSLNPGDLIRQGDILHLEQGMATLELNSGATVDLIAPASVTIRHDMHVTLWDGLLSSRVPERAHGFTVRTVDAEVVDLGTEFVVDRTRDTETNVIVKSGRVETRLLDVAGNIVEAIDLTAGRAVRVSLGEGLLAETEVLAEWNELWHKTTRVSAGVQQIRGDVRADYAQPLILTEGIHETRGHVLLIPEKLRCELNQELVLNSPTGKVRLKSGTQIDSYLIHYDAPFGTDQAAKGSVSFHGKVVAIISDYEQLRQTDELFGLDSTEWSVDPHSALEAEDVIKLEADQHTVKIHPGITGDNFLDQCRVLVLSDENLN